MYHPIYTVFAGENDWVELSIALRSLILGDPKESTVSSFEDCFGRFVGRKHAAAFGAGRMALFAILKTLRIGPGDEVILQGFTCNVVPRAILAAGATPVWVDIDPSTFNMDPDALARALGSRTRAVIVQHTFGIPPNARAIRDVCRGKDIAIIEDCAHAFLPLQTEDLGDPRGFSFFSTDHTKPINTHVGGVACTDSEPHARELARIAKGSRHLGYLASKRMQLTFLLEVLGHHPWLYPVMRVGLAVLTRLGFPFLWPDDHSIEGSGHGAGLFGMTPLQAELGIRQLQKANLNMEHRRKAFKALETALGWYGTARLHPVLRYAFTVRDRKAFYRAVDRSLRESTWFDSPVSGGGPVFQEVGYLPGSCPVAEWVAAHVVNIPIHSRIPTALYAGFDHLKEEVLRFGFSPPRELEAR